MHLYVNQKSDYDDDDFNVMSSACSFAEKRCMGESFHDYSLIQDFMPPLHLPRSLYNLFVYNIPYNFFGIVGSISHNVCVYIAYNHLAISFGDKLGQKLRETLLISYDNRKVIMQSS